jgi:putative membrane protein
MKKFIVLIGAVAAGILPGAATAQTDRSTEDQAFVNDAARGGEMEVKLGQLAEENGSSAAVKEFGSRMVKDHTRLNAELGATAKSVGLTVPDAISSEQQAAYDRLALVKGTRFDTEYINTMVKDHTEDLAAFEKEAKATRDAKLQGAVQAAIPVIEEHLKMAKNDSKKLPAS